MCAEHSTSSADRGDPFDHTEISVGEYRFSIRRFDESCVEPLRRFAEGLSDQSTRLFSPHSYDDETIRQYVERNRAGLDVSYLAVDADGLVAAYFFLWEADLDVPLLGIGVTDRWQNIGLGSRLMRVLIDLAKHLGKSGIDLTTMQDNERAFHVYERSGFIYVGDVENLTGDGRKVVERRMFLPLVEGATPPVRIFGPPDEVDHGSNRS